MIAVQYEDFDVAALYRRLLEQAGNAGAVVMFTGLVREFYEADGSDRSSVQTLTLEHYPGMTEKSLQAIVDRARERWTLEACRVVHRVGTLAAGEQIVFVGVASAHRGEAFEAAQFIMDYLKTSAPFWKKQATRHGSEWVEAKAADTRSAERWQGA